MSVSSYTPWNIKTAQIKTLYYRATKISSNQELLDDQMKKMFSFMSYNGFPNYVSQPLLRRLKSNSTIPSSNNRIEKNDIPETIFRLPYAGKVGKKFLKRCLKKVKLCLNSNINFRVLYDTKKMSFYCNIKDKVPYDQRNHVLYKIKYPSCNGCYIGKTERCLITRLTEHGTKETEPIMKLPS